VVEVGVAIDVAELTELHGRMGLAATRMNERSGQLAAGVAANRVVLALGVELSVVSPKLPQVVQRIQRGRDCIRAAMRVW
jgi:hypothetical protein